MSQPGAQVASTQEGNKPTDYKLRNGPLVDRTCTDLCCLVIFIGFTFFLWGVAVYAFKTGDPGIVSTPRDPDHRACGVDAAVKDYPYIYFANPNPNYLYVTTCVKACPSSNSTTTPASTTKMALKHAAAAPAAPAPAAGKPAAAPASKPMTIDCAVNSIVKSCASNPLAANPEAVVIIYESQLFMDVVCLPTSQALYDQVSSTLDVEEAQAISHDLSQTKWVIACSIIISLILGFIFLFMIEKCAGCMVWSVILLFIVMLLSGGVLCFTSYLQIATPFTSDDPNAVMTQQQQKDQVSQSNGSNRNKLYLGMIFFILAIIFSLIVCCMYKRIKLAIAILETASDYLQDNFTIVLLPFISFFIMILYFIFWFAVGVYLFSCGDISTQPKQIPFGQFTFSSQVKWFGWLHIFGLFWNQAFIIASVEFIICGSACIWYFQQGPRGQAGPNPVNTAVNRFFSYHLGTVAMGSFLLASVAFARLCLEYLYKNQEELVKKHKAFEFLINCCRCYLWCFDKCIQFINKNAYVICNMQGSGFFTSAKEAVFLILRNPLRFSAVGGLGEVIVSVGRAFISLFTALICYFYITRSEKYQDLITYPMAPSLLCGILGFVVGSTFMAVYGVACDAILLVFIMDEEMEKHNGKGIALSCPPKLEKFMEDQ